jgi:hypothetical protein
LWYIFAGKDDYNDQIPLLERICSAQITVFNQKMMADCENLRHRKRKCVTPKGATAINHMEMRLYAPQTRLNNRDASRSPHSLAQVVAWAIVVHNTALARYKCAFEVPNYTQNMDNDAKKKALQRILLTAAPLLSEPTPLPPLLQPATTAQFLAYLSEVIGQDLDRTILLMQTTDSGPARPQQGGQRITEEWLFSLKSRDCQWRFRCENLHGHRNCCDIFAI